MREFSCFFSFFKFIYIFSISSNFSLNHIDCILGDTAHHYAEGQKQPFKKCCLARRYLGSNNRYIAILSQINLLTTRQNCSKLRWENCDHYPKVRLDKQTVLFLPLTLMSAGAWVWQGEPEISLLKKKEFKWFSANRTGYILCRISGFLSSKSS